MNLRYFVMGLGIAATAAQAGSFEIADPAVLQKERQEWHAINIENVKLRQELGKAKKDWAQVSKAEAERDALVQQIEQSKDLVKFLADRRYRTWTSAKGAKVVARIASQTTSSLHLVDEQGTEMDVLITDLSSLDQSYLARVERALSDASEPAAEPPGEKILGLDDTKTRTIRVHP